MQRRLTISGAFLLLLALIAHGGGPWVDLARGQQNQYQLDYATYFGGSHGEEAREVVCTADGSIVFGGQTHSSDFPVTPGALQSIYAGGPSDGVLAVLSGDGSELLYATFLGGSGEDLIRGLTFGPDGGVILVGKTDSPDFPVTFDVEQPALAGDFDAFIVRLTNTAGPVPTVSGWGVIVMTLLILVIGTLILRPFEVPAD